LSEGISIELYKTGVHYTQIIPSPVLTAQPSHLEKAPTFWSSGIVKDLVTVAKAGYEGLRRSKGMVFSSYNAFPVYIQVDAYYDGQDYKTPTRGRSMELPKKDRRKIEVQ
jgi:short-subunit dehydrogenase